MLGVSCVYVEGACVMCACHVSCVCHVCDVCVMCHVLCVVLPRTSLSETHKVPLRNNQ